jgi:uncharacterized protein (TIGR00369 family)
MTGAPSGLEILRNTLDGAQSGSPFGELIGCKPVSFEPGHAVYEATPGPEHRNPTGMIHGGYACTLLDNAMAAAILTQLPPGKRVATTDIHVRFVRPLSTATGRILAEGRAIHLGRTQGTAEGTIVDETGRIYAHGTTACAIVARE